MFLRTRRHLSNVALAMLIAAVALHGAGCAADGEARTQEADSTTIVTNPASTEAATPSVNVELSRGYSAVHAMVQKNAQLDKLLWLKSVTPPTKELVNRLSKTSADTAAAIKQIAENSPAVELGDDGVAAIDAAARDGIEAATRKALLMSSGQTFEVQLILAQIRAMQWGAQMCEVLARMDETPAHRQRMEALGEEMARLRDDLSLRLTLAQ